VADGSLLRDAPATAQVAVGVGRRRSGVGSVLVYVIVVGGAAVVVFPFVWMFLGSFKDLAESNRYPPTFLPEVWRTENYREAWKSPPGTLGRYLLNTAIVATVGTALQLVFCALAAYAFAHLRFRGRELLFGLVLATAMVPGEVTLIPNFVTIRHFPLLGGNDLFGGGGSGLYDTYAAMIVPGLAGAFTIFLLRQSFLQVPRDLWEAAQVDGEGSLGYLRRVMLPLSLPALVTVAIFGFVGRWNALLWPLLVTRGERLRPVQLAMIYFQSEFVTNYGLIMAAALIVTLPVVLLFVLAQRQFVTGIAHTGLKG
jgi:multiple sugar transport system permease protein